MKCYLLIFMAILMAIENTNSLEWTPEYINLNADPTEIQIWENSTEYILSINDAFVELGSEKYYIYLWIKTMSCSIYTPDPDGNPDRSKPNYLVITAESDEIDLEVNKWRVCENITEDNEESGLNDIFHIGSPGVTKVTIKPVGDHWSFGSSEAVIMAQLRKHKTIILGSEIDQIDININPGTVYSLEINKEDAICNLYYEFECSLTVSISKMECPEWRHEYLEIVMESAGSNKTTRKICENIDFINSYSNYNNFYESTEKIVLRSVGRVSIIRVSTTLVLSSRVSNSYCPSGYFDCSNYHGSKCIREEFKCDGRPNCPFNYSADESSEFCDRFHYDDCSKYSYYDGIPMITFLFIFLLIIVGLAVVVMTFRCLVSFFNKPPNRIPVTPVRDPALSAPPPTYDDVIKSQAHLHNTFNPAV